MHSSLLPGPLAAQLTLGHLLLQGMVKLRLKSKPAPRHRLHLPRDGAPGREPHTPRLSRLLLKAGDLDHPLQGGEAEGRAGSQINPQCDCSQPALLGPSCQAVAVIARGAGEGRSSGGWDCWTHWWRRGSRG